jgi:hypothetical protein
MNDSIASLRNIDKDKLNTETYFAIEYINQEINKIISDPNNKYEINHFNYNEISIQKATNIILNKLKTSQNI